MGIDLAGLGDIITDPAVEKVFHAGEYDMFLLKRQYGWQLNNLFDTMWAARILGYDKYGLAGMLKRRLKILKKLSNHLLLVPTVLISKPIKSPRISPIFTF